MNTADKISFTLEDYEKFIKRQATVANQVYRDTGESFFDAMRSSDADFTKTDEGKGALEAIIAYGESRG